LTAVFDQIKGGSRPPSMEMALASRPFFDLLEFFEDRISRRVRETELPEWTKNKLAPAVDKALGRSNNTLR
ncbi:unnamed protein product, partial [Ectocarpus sp. 4 AP-2014]